MKFRRELLLDANQGAVLLDVSVLVGTKGTGGGCVCVWGGEGGLPLPSWVPNAFLTLRTKQTRNHNPLFAFSKHTTFPMPHH